LRKSEKEKFKKQKVFYPTLLKKANPIQDQDQDHPQDQNQGDQGQVAQVPALAQAQTQVQTQNQNQNQSQDQNQVLLQTNSDYWWKGFNNSKNKFKKKKK